MAGEIKHLAQQTVSATGEISNRISGAQKTTEESVQAIASIVGIINELNTLVTSVADTVQEQMTETERTSRSVDQAAAEVCQVNEKVRLTSQIAGQ